MPYANLNDKKAWKIRNAEKVREHRLRHEAKLRESPDGHAKRAEIEAKKAEQSRAREEREADRLRRKEERETARLKAKESRAQRKQEYAAEYRNRPEVKERLRARSQACRKRNIEKHRRKDRARYHANREAVKAKRKEAAERRRESERLRMGNPAARGRVRANQRACYQKKKANRLIEETIAAAAIMKTLPDLHLADSLKDFPERLRAARKRSNLSLRDASALLKIHINNLWAWEQGKCLPRFRMRKYGLIITDLANTLRFNLFGGDTFYDHRIEPKEFWAFVKSRLIEFKMSAKDFADKIGLCSSAISWIRRHDAIPSLNQLAAIGDVLRFNPFQLELYK